MFLFLPPFQPPLISYLRIISISIFQRFWSCVPKGGSGTCNSLKSGAPAWNHTCTQLLKLSSRLASSKLGFEECKFLTSYQSRKLAGSKATSAAFQPSSPKTCGCKGEERFRRTMVTASTKGKGQLRLCCWSGHGVVAGKLRGQLDLYPTGWWGVHLLITRCYCDNPRGSSTLKTKYGNVKLKPGEGKKRRQKTWKKGENKYNRNKSKWKAQNIFWKDGEKK